MVLIDNIEYRICWEKCQMKVIEEGDQIQCDIERIQKGTAYLSLSHINGFSKLSLYAFSEGDIYSS